MFCACVWKAATYNRESAVKVSEIIESLYVQSRFIWARKFKGLMLQIYLIVAVAGVILPAVILVYANMFVERFH
ncbi:hypothetical protein BH10CYA1_BH10CYA1_03550 [soil metagenome]